MNAQSRTLGKTSALLIEALAGIINADSNTLQAYVETYGEDGGERQYKAAGFPMLYEDLKKAVKLSLGDEMELNLMKIDNSVI